MRKTLLQLVNDILSDMDSEGVNTIADTVEATQVAAICESTFYDFVSTRDIEEHREFIKLTSLSNVNTPTHFVYGEDTKRIEGLWYKNDSDRYLVVAWMEPLDFINMIDNRSSSFVIVEDQQAGTDLRIRNNKHPQFYTSFDDEHVVMDSYDASVDDFLQNSKVRAYGIVHPSFEQTDTHTPDLDSTLFPNYVAECKSRAMSLLKGQVDPKVEQAARRHTPAQA